MKRPVVLAFLLVAPLFAGCFSDEPADAATEGVAANAEEAGAVGGPAPSAAKNPYQIEAGPGESATTVYPVAIQTNPPKMQYTQEFTGSYEAHECTAGGELPLGGLGVAEASHVFQVAEAFAKDDVFSFDVTMSFPNTDQSWGELHLWYRFDGVGGYWSEPVSEGRGDVVQNFTGQGLIASEDFFAGVGVDCWYGAITEPIPFTISLTVTFAEGAVPSQVPVLVRVPEGATRLFVTGVPIDPEAPVLTHFRVFAPDDSLVCECALNSDDLAATVDLEEAGDFVVLVDHTANGFVALALDAPPEGRLLPLTLKREQFPLVASEGSGVDETLSLDLPSTPLGLFAWTFAPGPIDGPPNLGAGHNVKIVVSNSRGDVLRFSMVGYGTYHAAAPGLFVTNDWYAIPLNGDWEFFIDHHAYDVGQHTVTVKADQLRGQVILFAEFYDRPA